jgi:hypothetical protein
MAACTGTTSEEGLDGNIAGAPYTEERTIGTNNNAGSTAAHGHSHSHGHATHSGTTTTIQSAEPVFQRGMVK